MFSTVKLESRTIVLWKFGAFEYMNKFGGVERVARTTFSLTNAHNHFPSPTRARNIPNEVNNEDFTSLWSAHDSKLILNLISDLHLFQRGKGAAAQSAE